MKLAIVSVETLQSVPGLGGLGVHVSELANALASRGHSVSVFTQGFGVIKGPVRTEKVDKVLYHRCPGDGPTFTEAVKSLNESFIAAIKEYEASHGPFDLVNCHAWHSVPTLVRMKEDGHKVVFTLHSIDRTRFGNDKEVQAQEQEGCRVADRVIAVCGPLAQAIEEEYKVPLSKLRIVPNGISIEKYTNPTDKDEPLNRYNTIAHSSSTRTTLEIAPGTPMVLFVGRLVKTKGPDLLVGAIPAIIKEHPTAKVVFVGEGTELHELTAQAASLGVQSHAAFVGRKDGEELISYYEAADVVVVPSRNELFGIVILEAWAARKPVVATIADGPSKIIWDGTDGFLTQINSDAIAAAVNKVVGDPELGHKMGNEGHHKAMNCHSWTVVAQSTQAVFTELVPHSAPAAPVSTSAPAPAATKAAQVSA